MPSREGVRYYLDLPDFVRECRKRGYDPVPELILGAVLFSILRP